MSDEPKGKANEDAVEIMEHIQDRIKKAERGKHGYKITQLSDDEYGYLGLVISLLIKEIKKL